MLQIIFFQGGVSMEKFTMEMLTMRKATMVDWEWAYEVSYRAHKKLISEGRGYEYGGMSEEDVRNSIRNGEIYLFYRKGDEFPVMMVSILRQESYPSYKELLQRISDSGEIRGCKEIPSSEVVILNAVAVRPELWGQGYCCEGLDAVGSELKKQGVKVWVGNYFHDEVRRKMLAGEKRQVYIGKPYKRKRGNGEILERRRFASVI